MECKVFLNFTLDFDLKHTLRNRVEEMLTSRNAMCLLCTCTKRLFIRNFSRKIQPISSCEPTTTDPIGKTIFQGLSGRDLLNFDGYTKNDIFSILWVASELKQSQKSPLSLCQGKRVSLIWTNPVIKASVSNACQRLNVALNSIYDEQVQKSSGNPEMLGRCLGATSDIIFVDAPKWNHQSIEKFAAGCTRPVVVISSNEYAPALACSEMFTLFEKYGFLRRLIIAYIGPGNNAMLNTYFTLLPTIGAHIRYMVYGTVDSLTPWEKGIKLSSRNNTEMKQFENVYDVLYRSHCISTCTSNPDTTAEDPSKILHIKNVKEMDLDWTILQHDSHKGLMVSADFLNAKDHNIIFHEIENQFWIFQALVLTLATDYSPSSPPPRFEGVD